MFLIFYVDIMAPKLIFLNIPVSDLESSKEFYLALGFTQNTMFSDASTICILVSEHIHVMLHEHERFTTWVRGVKASQMLIRLLKFSSASQQTARVKSILISKRQQRRVVGQM
jgi:predicted lactoylglutathione lyase